MIDDNLGNSEFSDNYKQVPKFQSLLLVKSSEIVEELETERTTRLKRRTKILLWLQEKKYI